ncbi:hypothetical protein KJ885_02995 [Patescibacteria group bacterium]|nr:hypothetical protein [Patescibacteria group bacterium]
MAKRKRKGGKRKRCRKKKKYGNTISIHGIIIKQRAGIKPGQVHQDKKKEADKKACRKEVTTDGSD